MRGVVTLAAAFVIPEDTPHREVLLLMAFTVVAGTLFIQGMSLPWLARRLRVPGPGPARGRAGPRHPAPAGVEGGAAPARRAGVRRQPGRRRPDPAAARPAQLRGLGAARHGRRPGVAQRPLRPDPARDAGGRAPAGARDPQRRHGAVRGRRRRAGACSTSRSRCSTSPTEERASRRRTPPGAGTTGDSCDDLERYPGRRRAARPSARAASTRGSSGSRCASASSAATSPAATPRSASTPPSTSTRPPTR